MNGLGRKKISRNKLRKEFYDACRKFEKLPSGLEACDAPVGSGKTTAIVARLLKIAADRDPQLRHIFVVLPYTNIITQAVEVLRKAIVLDGEIPEEIVAEHHHKIDFEEVGFRQLATLWRAPIIVTTAVQFFETIANHHPSRLRKLHELPGSAIFVDEAHAAMPSHIWPQMFRWIESLGNEWGCHFVFASGSLPRFWTIPDYQELIGQTT